MIELVGVRKEFGDGFVLFDHVDAQFDKSSFTFLTGRSGAGKTTFLRLILGVTKPSAGQVHVEDVDIHHLNRDQLLEYRRQVGVVYQDHMLLPYRTVFENLSLPLWIEGKSGRKIREQVDVSLGQLDLVDVANYYPNQLSAGEQQRVAIARSTINNPQLLLADEPTGNLDINLAHQTIDLLRHYNQTGIPVIVATHDEALIHDDDRVIHLQDGSCEEFGTESQ